MALVVTQDNQARFQLATAGMPLPGGVWNSVAGSPQPQSGSCAPQKTVPGPLLLAADGGNQANPASEQTPAPPELVAARTAVGLSKDHRYLYVLTVDGADGSECGAAFYDAASWMLRLGAFEALNLDGGGSTSLAMTDADGGVRLLNVPSDNHTTPCLQRKVPTFLGIKAAPLSQPAQPPSCCTVVSCSNPTVSTGTCGSNGSVCPPPGIQRTRPAQAPAPRRH
jgi:hypothetical protein